MSSSLVFSEWLCLFVWLAKCWFKVPLPAPNSSALKGHASLIVVEFLLACRSSFETLLPGAGCATASNAGYVFAPVQIDLERLGN